MKSSSIFWGVFFVSLGALLLLNQFEAINADLGGIVRFWPVLIVLFGVSLLNLPDIAKKIVSGAAGLFLALLIFGIITFQWCNMCFWDSCESDSNTSDSSFFGDTISSPKILTLDPAINSASLEINGGAMSLDIAGTTKELMEFNPIKPLFGVDISKTIVDSNCSVRVDVGLHSLKGKNKKGQETGIRLNPELPWDIKMDFGASKISADLSEYNIKSLNINCGAASVNIKLGRKADSTYVSIDGGAMSFDLDLPKEAGCSIFAKSFLSSKNFDGFTKKDGVYYSKNFNKAKKKIFIEINGAMASYNVRWY